MLHPGRAQQQFNSGAAQDALLPLLLRTLAAAVLSTLAAVALLMLARRMSGVAVEPFGAPVMLTIGGVLALVGLLVRAVWSFGESTDALQRGWRVFALATFVLLLAAASLTFLGAGAWALAGLWAPLVAAESAAWIVSLRRRRRYDASRRGRQSSVEEASEFTNPAPRTQPTGEGVWDRFDGWFSDSALPAGAVQQILRASDGGAETIACRLRGAFEPGQRALNLHVAFCPPLATAPTMHVRQTAGPPVKVDASFAQPFGARLELRLAQTPSEAVEVLVEAIARQTPSGDAEM